MVTGVGAWLNKVVGGWVARQRERESERKQKFPLACPTEQPPHTEKGK